MITRSLYETDRYDREDTDSSVASRDHILHLVILSEGSESVLTGYYVIMRATYQFTLIWYEVGANSTYFFCLPDTDVLHNTFLVIRSNPCTLVRVNNFVRLSWLSLPRPRPDG